MARDSTGVSAARVLAALGCALAIVLAAGCGGREPEPRSGPPDDRQVAAAVHQPRRARIVVLGDSLTAGLGLNPEQAYPTILQQRVDAAGFDFEVVNAGVSGDTSAGGLRRLEWSLADEVCVLVVALGGNDALRGLPVEELRSNLEVIIKQARSKNIVVLLAGMEAPPNFGRAYTDGFRGVYASLAKQYDVALVPFLLEGVAGVESMNQRDGLHPTAEGAQIAADNVWARLEPMLETLKGPGPEGDSR